MNRQETDCKLYVHVKYINPQNYHLKWRHVDNLQWHKTIFKIIHTRMLLQEEELCDHLGIAIKTHLTEYLSLLEHWTVALEWLTLLLRIREFLGSNLGLETDWGVFFVLLGKCRYSTLNRLRLRPSFTNRPVAWCYIVCAAHSVVKQTTNIDTELQEVWAGIVIQMGEASRRLLTQSYWINVFEPMVVAARSMVCVLTA
jgi:hypothetical protein